MAQITIDIPNNQLVRVSEALAFLFRYDTAKVTNESKPAFAKRVIARQIKAWVVQAEKEQAEEVARALAESEITVT